jgi:hypothetical protein
MPHQRICNLAGGGEMLANRSAENHSQAVVSGELPALTKRDFLQPAQRGRGKLRNRLAGLDLRPFSGKATLSQLLASKGNLKPGRQTIGVGSS